MKLSPKAKNILTTAGNFIYSFITAVVAIVAVIFVLIKLLGWHMFSVDSPSMSPRYPVDTLVVVQDVSPEEIKTGDVITYVLNGDGVLVTHRVVAVNTRDRTFTTKGDANNSEDAAPVLWNNMVGRVFLGIPVLGRPVRFLTAEENRPVVIAVIAIMFVSSVVWDMVEKRNRKKRKPAEMSHAKAPDGGPQDR